MKKIKNIFTGGFVFCTIDGILFGYGVVMKRRYIYSIAIIFGAICKDVSAGPLDKLINKWNTAGQISEKDFNKFPTVQDYFTHRFKPQRTITMNNVSYAAGTIMWDRANAYCERDGGSFVQLKAHPTPLRPYRGSELLDTPNLQKYYGLFACQGISNSWKVYFDHQNERIFEYPSPNTASDVSYSFE